MDDAARQHLASLLLPPGFERSRIVSSPLARATETAQILFQKVPELVPELVEMDWGVWEGQRGVDLLADVNSGYRHIEEWGWDFQPPGGETPAIVRKRLEPWLDKLSGLVVAVTHIGIMRVLLASATGWEFRGAPPFKVKRDRLYVIDLYQDGSLSHGGVPLGLIRRTGA